MKTENVSRAVLAGGAVAVLAAAALLYVPEQADRTPPPAPGPAERAAKAVNAGGQAALPDLGALIGDREKWLRAHPGDEASWATLGAAYTERGVRRADPADLPRAEAALKRSLAVRPAGRGNLDAQLGMAALANARGDWKTAREWAERVRKADPKRWPAYPVLIDAYNGLGDYKAAGKATETLTGLHSGAAVSARSAQLYRNRGWREDASAAAADAVALAATDPDKAAALARLGDLAWERGEPAEALAQYGAALGLVPEHGPSLAGRARAHAALGRTSEAVRDWRAALERLPLPEYLLEAGELYEALDRDEEAQALYERLRTGSWPGAEVVLGRLDADHGDPAAAVRRLRAEWARGHRSVQVADALGWALFRSGAPKEALEFAKRATDEGLRSALFAYHRGEIERALEDHGPARRHLAEALRTHPSFSPLFAPRARAAVKAVGEPADVLPGDVRGEGASEPEGSGKPPAPEGSGKPESSGTVSGSGKPESSGTVSGSGKPEEPGKPE
ncbi:tetratricopeptide repeat protein [Streptomyces roseicoloratus]|uniref:Tetratricopeptide repeat protein n=1 Tax=Streptomyces roseicoloratus TaxID=2508722 RepID=A0ABY9RXB1_9ACTN|nr:tetratricopeptide repeat protein [Streptomyces roseicoloratus]WMX46809.1 tetratricopeptide repeat protein [Streptomyces roseicoloratus]